MATVNAVRWDVNPAKTSIKDLRNELKLLKDQMANLEEGSDAFLEIANKAGEVKHQIDEINESVKGASADFGDMLGNVTNVMAGITGAFQAVAGGLQAIGVESEAIDKTIAKMQGLMAVTQGLSAIDDGIKSFAKLTKAIDGTTKAGKALKVVMQPKVLLAVAAVITSIVLAFKNWEGAIRDALPFVDKICNAFGRVHPDIKKATEEQEKFNKKLAEEYAIIKAQQDETASEADKIRLQRRLDKLTDEAKAKLRVAQEDIILAQDNYDKALMKKAEVTFSGDAFALRVLEAQLKTYEQSIKKNKALVESILKDDKWIKKEPKQPTTPTTPTPDEGDNVIKPFEGIIDITDEINKKLEEKYDIQLEKLKRSNKTNAEKLQEEIEIENKRLQLYEQGTIEYERQQTKIYNLNKEYAELTKKEVKTEIDQIIELGNAAFNTLKETMGMFGESSLGLTGGWVKSLEVFQTAFNQTMDIVKTKGEAGWTDYAQVAATALGGIGSMLNALSQEQDVSTKEGFEQQKKLQIAATIMNMLSGIMSAWTSAMSPANSWMTLPGQIAMGTITSAMIAGVGGAQIAKIKSQTMNSAMASGAIQPSSSAIGTTIMPPVQYSNAVQGASTEGAIQSQKVIVTESDIVGTINKVEVQQSENTY